MAIITTKWWNTDVKKNTNEQKDSISKENDTLQEDQAPKNPLYRSSIQIKDFFRMVEDVFPQVDLYLTEKLFRIYSEAEMTYSPKIALLIEQIINLKSKVDSLDCSKILEEISEKFLNCNLNEQEQEELLKDVLKNYNQFLDDNDKEIKLPYKKYNEFLCSSWLAIPEYDISFGSEEDYQLIELALYKMYTDKSYTPKIKSFIEDVLRSGKLKEEKKKHFLKELHDTIFDYSIIQENRTYAQQEKILGPLRYEFEKTEGYIYTPEHNAIFEDTRCVAIPFSLIETPSSTNDKHSKLLDLYEECIKLFNDWGQEKHAPQSWVIDKLKTRIQEDCDALGNCNSLVVEILRNCQTKLQLGTSYKSTPEDHKKRAGRSIALLAYLLHTGVADKNIKDVFSLMRTEVNEVADEYTKLARSILADKQSGEDLYTSRALADLASAKKKGLSPEKVRIPYERGLKIKKEQTRNIDVEYQSIENEGAIKELQYRDEVRGRIYPNEIPVGFLQLAERGAKEPIALFSSRDKEYFRRKTSMSMSDAALEEKNLIMALEIKSGKENCSRRHFAFKIDKKDRSIWIRQCSEQYDTKIQRKDKDEEITVPSNQRVKLKQGDVFSMGNVKFHMLSDHEAVIGFKTDDGKYDSDASLYYLRAKKDGNFDRLEERKYNNLADAFTKKGGWGNLIEHSLKALVGEEAVDLGKEIWDIFGNMKKPLEHNQ